MYRLKLYHRPGEPPPLADFLAGLDAKLAKKTLQQLFRLADTPLSMMKEPHVKHFSIEKYNRFYELRERSKVCVRVIFTMQGGDILLLAPFIKRRKRDAMGALELSLKMLADIQADPAFAADIRDWKEEFVSSAAGNQDPF